MISRLRRAPAFAALLAAAALLTVACQKVPLLAPSGSNIVLTALASSLPSNGTTDIIAQVIEPSGTPPQSGTQVTFTTNLGTVQPSSAETDASGRVTVKYVAGSTSGTATITAISGGVSASGTNAIKIAVGSAAATTISASAAPGTVAASGGTATITAKVFDSGGNLLPGVPVTFTTDNGSLAASVVNTDATGTATTQLTTNKTSKVTVSAGVSTSTGGTTTTTTAAPTASVTVNVNAASTITVGTPSPALPTVGIPVTFPLTIAVNANGSSIQKVVVDFGDGSSPATLAGTATSATHSYNTAGSFTVRATATDALGDIATGSSSVTVGSRPQPTVSISVSANATAGTTTTFTLSVQPAAGSNTVISDVTMDFGDGTAVADLGASSGTSIQVQHVYQVGGTYTVTANARDSNGGTSPAAIQIVVQDQPPLSVTITSTQNTSGASTFVNFTATVTPTTAVVSNYHWDFGDGNSVNTGSNQTTHTYTALSGTKVVTVTITTTQGKTATGQTTIQP